MATWNMGVTAIIASGLRNRNARNKNGANRNANNRGGVVMDSPLRMEDTMSDEIRSLMSWDGTGKIYSEETVRALQAEIARWKRRLA